LVEGLRRNPARVVLVYCGLAWIPLMAFWSSALVRYASLALVVLGFLLLTATAAWMHREPSKTNRVVEAKNR
jgi:hypothetical protein